MIKVTVIIPIYNMERFILKGITTVIEQSLSEIEILCINDASTDTSLEILLTLAQKDRRIRIISNKENIGVAKSRNIGIENAKGEYITFFDADDIYPPYALETLYSGLINSKASISRGNFVAFDNNLRYFKNISSIDACLLAHTKEEVNPMTYLPLFLSGRHQSFMFKKSLLIENKVRYPELLAGEDRIFIAHAVCHANIVAVCPDIVYYYRADVEYNRKKSSKYILDEIHHYLECYNVYKEHGYFANATFFIYASLEGELRPLRWLKRTKEEKKALLHIIKLFSSSKEYETNAKNFAPYPFNISETQRNVRIITRFPNLFPYIKIFEKIKNYVFPNKK